MINKESSLDLPYIAIIPYRIQCDDAIPDSVKIYFGQLSALSVKFGYCWATDEHLAEMKTTSISNIKRWNSILEKSGYIVRETKNIPIKEIDGKFSWIKKRKIYVNIAFANEKPLPLPELENSNNSFEGIKNDTSYEGIKNDTSYEGIKNDTYNIKPLREKLNKQPQQSATPVVVPSLEKIDISESLRFKISSSYSVEEIDLAVKRTLKWAGRPSDDVGIMAALKKADTWKDNLSPDEKQDENSEFLKTIVHLDGKKIGVTSIIVGNKYIEFNSGMKTLHLKIDDNNFIKLTTEYLEFLNIVIKTNEKEPDEEIPFSHFAL